MQSEFQRCLLYWSMSDAFIVLARVKAAAILQMSASEVRILFLVQLAMAALAVLMLQVRRLWYPKHS